MRTGGAASEDNTTDILTKNLQPHLHQKHCTHLHILAHKNKHEKKGTTSTNNSLRLTSLPRQEVGARSDDRDVSLTQNASLANSHV
jgi:hypothetical protein